MQQHNSEMCIVAALGGNALLRRGEAMSEMHQRANIRSAVSALRPLIENGHRLLITHGNGPQIGMLAIQNSAGPPDGQCGLDVIGAQSQGMIGYLIEQELRNVLSHGRSCVTLLTQVLVDVDDKAFQRFEKPIGTLYPREEADRLHHARGWTFVKEKDLWRRAVPSPLPVEILGLESITQLTVSGAITICLGGGGIPVVRDEGGTLRGVEAVIDKDHASALLAKEIGADALLLLTDVDGVFGQWSTQDQTLLRFLDPQSVNLDDLEAGSMRPKVAAACEFVRATGKLCVIGRLEAAAELLAGTQGTRIACAANAQNGS